eukprot:m51a1_g11072 putative spindle and kinetochore-associated protein 1 (267) ;mRNA; r:556844-557644
MQRLREAFEEEVRELKSVLVLRGEGRGTRSEWSEELLSLCARVDELERTFRQLRSLVDREKTTLEAASKQLRDSCTTTEASAKALRVSLAALAPQQDSPSRDRDVLVRGNESIDSARKRQLATPPDPDLPKEPHAKRAKRVPEPPSIALVTPEELEAVPKYMRGRLTADKVNDVIGELHKALADKARLCAASKAKLTDQELDRVQLYKDVEAEVGRDAAQAVVAESDVKQQVRALNVDKMLSSTLRHLGRMKEVTFAGTRCWAFAL